MSKITPHQLRLAAAALPSLGLPTICQQVRDAADLIEELQDALAADMQAVGEALMDTIRSNHAALTAVGWSGPMDCPSEIVADLLNLIDEAKAAPIQAQEDARDAKKGGAS